MKGLCKLQSTVQKYQFAGLSEPQSTESGPNGAAGTHLARPQCEVGELVEGGFCHGD